MIRFLELEPDDPPRIRRTPDGQHGGGKTLGRRRSLTDDQVDGQADEGHRGVGEEDRAAPGGQRKDGAERPRAGP